MHPPFPATICPASKRALLPSATPDKLCDILHSSLGVALLPDSSRALLSAAIPPLLPCSVACSVELLLAPQALVVILHQPRGVLERLRFQPLVMLRSVSLPANQIVRLAASGCVIHHALQFPMLPVAHVVARRIRPGAVLDRAWRSRSTFERIVTNMIL